MYLLYYDYSYQIMSEYLPVVDLKIFKAEK